jgi:hypothetical protein
MERLMVHTDILSVQRKVDECKAIEHLVVQNGFDCGTDTARSRLYSHSRMMVSASFWQAVDVMVDLLDRERPFIRAVPLIG